jgi:hypothetical protein
VLVNAQADARAAHALSNREAIFREQRAARIEQAGDQHRPPTTNTHGDWAT